MTILPLSAGGRDGRKPRRPCRTPLLSKQGHGDGDRGGASFPGAVFNLSTTMVGAGIMALPAAVKVLGLISGFVMILLAAALTQASIDMILRAGRPPTAPGKAAGASTSTSSYATVVGDALGGPGRALLQSCIVINNLGMLVVYMIIIGNSDLEYSVQFPTSGSIYL